MSYITLREAADKLCITPKQVLALADKGILNATQTGKGHPWMVDSASVDRVYNIIVHGAKTTGYAHVLALFKKMAKRAFKDATNHEEPELARIPGLTPSGNISRMIVFPKAYDRQPLIGHISYIKEHFPDAILLPQGAHLPNDPDIELLGIPPLYMIARAKTVWVLEIPFGVSLHGMSLKEIRDLNPTFVKLTIQREVKQ